MADWLSNVMGYVNPIVGGVSAISGLLGGSSEKRRQQAAIQSAMSQYGQALDAQNNNALGQELQSLYSGTGVGNDAVRNNGMGLGDVLSRSGVYNSSALAGALANQSIGNAANVASMYANMDAARKQQYAQGQQNLANMRLGVAMPMFTNAQNQMAGTANGLQQWLQGITQQNNQQTGVAAQMNGLGQGNGNAGKGGFGSVGENTNYTPFNPFHNGSGFNFNAEAPLNNSGGAYTSYNPFNRGIRTNAQNPYQLHNGYVSIGG
jgi:hypothetical protein